MSKTIAIRVCSLLFVTFIPICSAIHGTASAATILASGQLLTPGDPAIPPGQPGHDDSRENFVYSIDTRTGIATPISPSTTGLPSALAINSEQRLLGFRSGQLNEVEPSTGSRTDIGSDNGLSSTAFEILPGNRGFILPFDNAFA
ncbi:MAG: hypothetical protein AAGA03_00205, partial [Planctomycetota bacterium]